MRDWPWSECLRSFKTGIEIPFWWKLERFVFGGLYLTPRPPLRTGEGESTAFRARRILSFRRLGNSTETLVLIRPLSGTERGPGGEVKTSTCQPPQRISQQISTAPHLITEGLSTAYSPINPALPVNLAD